MYIVDSILQGNDTLVFRYAYISTYLNPVEVLCMCLHRLLESDLNTISETAINQTRRRGAGTYLFWLDVIAAYLLNIYISTTLYSVDLLHHHINSRGEGCWEQVSLSQVTYLIPILDTEGRGYATRLLIEGVWSCDLSARILFTGLSSICTYLYEARYANSEMGCSSDLYAYLVAPP